MRILETLWARGAPTRGTAVRIAILAAVVLAEWFLYAASRLDLRVPTDWGASSWATTADYQRLSTEHTEAWAHLEIVEGQATFAQPSATIDAVACRIGDGWFNVPGSAEQNRWVVTETSSVQRLKNTYECLARFRRGSETESAYVSPPWSIRNVLLALQISLVVGAFLGLPIAYFVLWRFKRRVLRGLGSAMVPTRSVGDGSATSSGALRPRLVARALPAPPSSTLAGRARRATLRLAVLSGLIATSVALLIALLDPGLELSAPSLLRSLCVCWGPVAIPLIGLAVVNRKAIAGAVAAYAVLVPLIIGWTTDVPAMFVLVAAGKGLAQTAALLLLAHRRIRAFVPIIAISTVFFMGLNVPFMLMASSKEALQYFVQVTNSLGFRGANAPLALACLVAALALVLATWPPARILARSYSLLRMNDRVLVGSVVLGMYVVFGALFAQQLVLLASILPVLAVLFIASGNDGRRYAERPPRILFLRVFGRDSTVADRFAALCRDLLNVARVDLIAGPDLAASLVQPSELLDFLVGKFSRKYIHDEKGFEDRVRSFDERPDLEGRCRVREFYCVEAIWTAVFKELARSADLVVIDLRGFTRDRAGTAFELRELIHRHPLARVLAIVDSTTDREALDRELASAWTDLPADSPNASASSPALPIFEIGTHQWTSVRALLEHVCHIVESTERTRPGPERLEAELAGHGHT